MKARRRIRRGAFSRDECLFVGAWVPTEWVHKIDQAVREGDIDRSKYLRLALSEKIARQS